MVGEGGHQVIGMMQCCAHEFARMWVVCPIHVSASIPPDSDQPSQSQLGKMLAGCSGWSAGESRQSADVVLGLVKQPQKSQARAIGEHLQGSHRGIDLCLVGKLHGPRGGGQGDMCTCAHII